MVFLAIGEHFQRRLGLSLNMENPFHGVKRERPVAQRPLQGVDQIAVVVVSPQGQNLAALRFALAMGLQQPFEKTLSDRAELGEAPAQQFVLLAAIVRRAMGGIKLMSVAAKLGPHWRPGWTGG